jgi:hypothetical protein
LDVGLNAFVSGLLEGNRVISSVLYLTGAERLDCGIREREVQKCVEFRGQVKGSRGAEEQRSRGA